MRNLKKLSLALMLTTLFSISFTSCIDTDVDPAVIAIYDAQADLIAAQASVQNAEAAYLLAQAAAEQAAADELAAITARYTALTVTELMEATAAAELAVEEARIAMLLAQAEFDQDMAQILAAIRAAQNVEAGTHAADYATAMGQLATLRGQKLTLLGSIATKELYMQNVAAGTEMTWETYLANLERDVLAKEASVIANEEYIVRANAYLGDYDAMVIALDAANAAVTAKQAEIQALLDEDTQIDTDIAAAGTFDTFQTDYEAALLLIEGDGTETAAAASGLEGNLAFYTTSATTLSTVTIPGLNTTIANYDGTTTTLEGVVTTTETAETAANTAITNAAAALGVSLGTPVFGDTASALTTLYADLYNAQLIAADKAQDLVVMEAAFAALTATYNAAAVALTAAQVAYDAADYAGDLATAEGLETTAQSDLTAAELNYTNMTAAYTAAPTGSVDADGAMLGVDDLGEIGITTDLEATTYMRVTDWAENSLGSGEYIPTQLTGQFDAAGLAAELVTLALADANVALWGQTGAGTDAALAPSAIIDGGTSEVFINGGEVVNAAAGTTAYFLEVEAGDTSITNLFNFNVATNELGLDDFTARAFTTSGAGTVADPYVWEAVLIATDANAGYDSTPDTNGAADTAADVLTAYANAWNAALEVAKKENALDLGDDALVAAQDAFDAQQELFDNGVANIAALEGEIATADTAATTAQTAVTTATTALGTTLGVATAGSTVSVLTTLYADLWNAEIANLIADAALSTHLATTVPMYEALLVTAEADLVTANNMISEINILIVRAQADIDALTAEYEALVATPLYAAQQVRILEIADEVAVLNAEKAVLVTEAGALAITIAFEGSATILAIDNAIIAAQAVIDGAPAYYAMKAAQIALGEVTVENLVAEVAKLNEDIAALDAQIAAKEIEAAGYLALLQAALAG